MTGLSGKRIWILLILCACVCTGQTQPSSFAALAEQASAARTNDHLDEAMGFYKQALLVNPNWAEGWWWLGTMEYDQNSYREAVVSFGKLAALDSRAGSARVMLGLCEFELGDESAALEHIQAGEQIGVADDRQLRNVALFHEGLLLQRAGKFESSEQALNSLCTAGVESNELHLTLGMTALRIRGGNAPDTEVVNGVGGAECLAAQKKFDQAGSLFADIVRNHPKFHNIHYAYGRLLLEARKTDAGIGELEEEISNYPDDAIPRLEIAAAKYKTDSAAGLPYAEAAVKLNPGLPFGHYLLGLLLLDTDDYKRAIPELETARKGMAEAPAVYSALGSAYSRAGRGADAASARAEFLRLSKTSTAAAVPQP